MARRKKRQEPIWPFLLILGVVAGGLGLGRLLTGGDDSPRTSEALDAVTLDESGVPSPENRVMVEVLNGSGVPGVAAAATDLLRDLGLDVVYFGNEGSFGRETSEVVDRTGRDGARDAVSRALGIPSVRAESDTTRLVDVTVFLGSDWNPDSVALDEEQVGEPPVEGRAWWDPRRFLERGR